MRKSSVSNRTGQQRPGNDENENMEYGSVIRMHPIAATASGFNLSQPS